MSLRDHIQALARLALATGTLTPDFVSSQ